MKKEFYLTIFIIFGILFAFLVHAIAEVWYIDLLIRDFQKYSLDFSWSQWFVIHRFIAILLFILGAFLGFWQGKFWWQKLYEK